MLSPRNREGAGMVARRGKPPEDIEEPTDAPPITWIARHSDHYEMLAS